MSKDYSDPNVVGKRNKKIALEAQKWQESLRTLMLQPEGVRVIRGILDKSRMLAPDLYAGSTNDTMYRLGQRDIGVWFYNELINTDVDLLRKIITGDDNGK